jgi:hypothetical protein
VPLATFRRSAAVRFIGLTGIGRGGGEPAGQAAILWW